MDQAASRGYPAVAADAKPEPVLVFRPHREPDAATVASAALTRDYGVIAPQAITKTFGVPTPARSGRRARVPRSPRAALVVGGVFPRVAEAAEYGHDLGAVAWGHVG